MVAASEIRRKHSGEVERRTHTTTIELRDNGSNELELVGMPIVYSVPYTVTDAAGSFSERMQPGVVSDLLATGKEDTVFFFGHSGLPMARTTSGTLTLRDGPKGLQMLAKLDARRSLDTDVAIGVERGDINQMSVAFNVGHDTWDSRWENRTIHKLSRLQDVSAVVFGASPTTTISKRHRMTTADLRRMKADDDRRIASTRGAEYRAQLAKIYDRQLRAKYSDADRARLAKSGQALGDGSYPIADADDLDRALKMVGLGSAPSSTIRRHIIKRAHALGLASKLPAHWNSDGSLAKSGAAK